jgi:hypothetical protein
MKKCPNSSGGRCPPYRLYARIEESGRAIASGNRIMLSIFPIVPIIYSMVVI